MFVLLAIAIAASASDADEKLFRALSEEAKGKILKSYVAKRFNSFSVASEFELPEPVIKLVIAEDKENKRKFRERKKDKEEQEKEAARADKEEREMKLAELRAKQSREQQEAEQKAAEQVAAEKRKLAVTPEVEYDKFGKYWRISTPYSLVVDDESRLYFSLFFMLDETKRDREIILHIGLFSDADVPAALIRCTQGTWLNGEHTTNIVRPRFDDAYKTKINFKTKKREEILILEVPEKALLAVTKTSDLSFKVGTFGVNLTDTDVEAIANVAAYYIRPPTTILKDAKAAAKPRLKSEGDVRNRLNESTPKRSKK